MKSGVIYIRLNEILEKKEKSLYWLSASAGVPYPTLWKLIKKESQRSVNLQVLSRICSALDCLPGDILAYEEDEEDSAIKNLAGARDAKARLVKSKERKEKRGKT